MSRKNDMDLQAGSRVDLAGFTIPDFTDFLPDPTFMIDCDGRVILWNKAIEAMTGVPASAILGRGDYEYALPFYAARRPMLVDIVIHPEQDYSDRYYLFKKTDELISGEIVVPNLRGGQRHMWGNAAPVRNGYGEIIGAVETIRDITDVKFSLDRLLLQTEKCRHAFENIQDVYYEVSLEGIFMEISPSVKNVLGWEREELIGTSISRLYANPADRDVFLRRITDEGGVNDYEILFKRPDGSLLNISINARHFPGGDHEYPRNIGSMRNITRRKIIEEKLISSEERYRTLVENISVAVNRTTPPPNGRFLMVNPAFVRMFGFSSEDEALMTDPVESYFDPAERENFARLVIECGGLSGYEMRFRKRDGTPLWGAMTAKAVFDKETGKALFFDCLIEDVTARKKTEEEMRRLAYYDGLTGLPNRALFMDRLQMSLVHAARDRTRVVLMMFDLDLFKNVNDTMGHLAGDRLLQSVSGRLVKRLRKSDTIARLGGDEFMVIYAGVRDVGQADMLAVKLLNVFNKPFILGNVPVNITASIGVAVYPDDAGDLDMMLRNVDVALYKAKDDGGNAIRRYVGGKDVENVVQLSRGRFSSYLYLSPAEDENGSENQ
jgi:diguanylate cyclase (GGDEF)-like protein/PAS domain S-box-containing protein